MENERESVTTTPTAEPNADVDAEEEPGTHTRQDTILKPHANAATNNSRLGLLTTNKCARNAEDTFVAGVPRNAIADWPTTAISKQSPLKVNDGVPAANATGP